VATLILQARVGSTRLPGKALKPILGKPMLWYTIETLKLSNAADRIVMAIPDNPADDVLIDLAAECNIEIFRGSEPRVLERFYQAALKYKDDSENPDRSLEHLKTGAWDYVVERGMPLGTVVEAFTFEALERAYKEGSSPEDIEHVTWYIKKSGKFKVKHFDCPPEYRFPGLRLTVDYPEDFQRVEKIIEHLYNAAIPPFKDVIRFIQPGGMRESSLKTRE
jgi:spore coat polysaccharide biosynthesis protein SpsF